MILEEALGNVPDFNEFMTVEEHLFEQPELGLDWGKVSGFLFILGLVLVIVARKR